MHRAASEQTSNYARAVARRINRRIDAFDAMAMHKAWTEATPAEQDTFTSLVPELISAAEFDFLLSIAERFTTAVNRRLRAEDQNFIAFARCSYMDAVDCAARGVIDEAFMYATLGVKKMDFVVNKRKRQAENRDYHNIPEYPRIWQDLRLLLEDMQRALAMFERAHKAVQR
jgi:hypothetical protein